jgi:hypothetical protein
MVDYLQEGLAAVKEPWMDTLAESAMTTEQKTALAGMTQHSFNGVYLL